MPSIRAFGFHDAHGDIGTTVSVLCLHIFDLVPYVREATSYVRIQPILMGLFSFEDVLAIPYHHSRFAACQGRF